MIETKWVKCAALEYEKNHQVPQPLMEWEQALAEGWEPAGPSAQVNMPEMLLVWAMVKRPVARLNLEPFAPGAVDE